ncbi:MAG TPA: hypothetical protein VF195_00890 [Actinomycetota bacterium]
MDGTRTTTRDIESTRREMHPERPPETGLLLALDEAVGALRRAQPPFLLMGGLATSILGVAAASRTSICSFTTVTSRRSSRS